MPTAAHDTTQLLELKAGAMAAGGGCVARAGDGRVVFVRHALPGEKVLARVTAEATHYLRADAVEVLEPSPDRVVPLCRYAGPGRCGGCDWQHVALAAQRRLKAGLIAEQLRRLAGMEPSIEVEEVDGAPDGLGWRTRVRFAVDGGGFVGLHRHRSSELEYIDQCLIASPGVEAVGAERHKWPGAAEIEVLSAQTGTDRVVAVSTNHRHLKVLPEVNAGVVVDGQVVQPPGGIRQVVLGRSYRVTAGVFWQVHPAAAETLALAVLEGLAPRRGESVVDLYAGVGLFAVLLGDVVGPSGSVLAVEAHKAACADAVRNASDQPQVKIRVGVVEAAAKTDQLGRPDLVVLDPPRTGPSRAVIDWLIRSRPRRVAYVACDAASFARDVRRLSDAGWTMPSLRAFDLFPMTEHVELVGIFQPPG